MRWLRCGVGAAALAWAARMPDGLAATRDLLIDDALNRYPTSFTEPRLDDLIETPDAGIEHHTLLLNSQFGI